MQTLPLTTDPRQTMDAQLGNVRVRLAVYWNVRDKSWFLDAELPGEQRLATGRRIAVRVPLVRHPDMPGDLWCVPVGELGEEPGLKAWGSTHHLQYRP